MKPRDRVTKIIQYRDEGGMLHRSGGLPAHEEWRGNKLVRREYWVHGDLHRGGGKPAIEVPGECEIWYEWGRMVRHKTAPGVW